MRRKTLIICIAAALTLSAGVAALYLWPESDPGTPDVSPVIETADLIQETRENITSIRFDPSGGVPYTIRHDSADDDYTLDAADAVFPGRLSAMRSMFTYATSLTNLTQVTDSATDEQLALFGLNAPVMTWRINRADGTSVELMAGAVQATGKGRYARLRNSREVVLLNEWQSSFLAMNLEEFYDLSFLPPHGGGEDPAWAFIEHIILEKADGGVIEVRKRAPEEISYQDFIISQYEILQPVEGDTNDYMLQTVMLDPLSLIAPDQFETALPAELPTYGLDNPARLAISGGGWSGALLIGRHDAERGGRYVMIEGHDAVLFDSKGVYTFLNTNYTDIRVTTVFLYDIKTVSSVVFDLNGVERILSIEHTGEDELTGRLDGAELTESNTRRLYRGAIGITQNGETDAPIPAGSPVYTIKINFSNGKADTLELYRLNDLQFLIVVNGVNQNLFINRRNLQSGLLDRFDMLDRGEDLPR
jgi:hypothetical protein